MSTWVRTDKAGGVFLYEIPAGIIKSIEVCERPIPEPGEVWCGCCMFQAAGNPCKDSPCTSPGGCATCQDLTCPCCASVVECLDEEPEKA